MIVEEEIKTSDTLNESIFDIFKRAWTKARNWITGFWSKVKKIVSKSWQALINFMGLEPEITFNKTIKW